MKNILFLLTFLAQMAIAQEAELIVKVNPDTVLFGNSVKIRYEVQNAKGDFVAPEMPGFEIIGGPNYSSSFSMINGETSSMVTYSYVLLPLEEGNLNIGPASIGELISKPIEIVVLPNPEGIINERKGEYSMPDSWFKSRKPAERNEDGKEERKKSIRI